jgi:hypothetical protein
MSTRILAILVVVLGPVVLAFVAGREEAAQYLGVGCVLALQLGLLARPIATSAVMLPVVYAAAALTAASTQGVVALIVAIAAAVGAASSKGLHRGLVALLGAALLGSFDPGETGDVVRRAALMLVGSTYGFVLATTALRGVRIEVRGAQSQAAIGYAVLLAVLALVAWFAARYGNFAYAWWLPLAIVAVSEPGVAGSARNSVLRIATGLAATFVLVTVVHSLDADLVRGGLLVAMVLGVLLLGRNHPAGVAVLVIPMLALLSSPSMTGSPPGDYLPDALVATLPILLVTCIAHWAFWMLHAEDARALPPLSSD